MNVCIRPVFAVAFFLAQTLSFPAWSGTMLSQSNQQRIIDVSGLSADALAEISQGVRLPTKQEKLIMYGALTELIAAAQVEVKTAQRSLDNKTTAGGVTTGLGLGILETSIFPMMSMTYNPHPAVPKIALTWFSVGAVLTAVGVKILSSEYNSDSVKIDRQTIDQMKFQIAELKKALRLLATDLND